MGGCWFYRFKKSDNAEELSGNWETLVFSLIGEQFNEPKMYGAVLSVRGRETVIEIWFEYNDSVALKSEIFDKISNLLQTNMSQNLYFKSTCDILKDNSTVKNAQTFAKHRKSTFY